MADNYVMRVRRGDSYAIEVSYRDPTGDLIDLSGFTVEWEINLGELHLVYTDSPRVVFADGILTLSLSKADTEAFIDGRGRHFLRVTTGPSAMTLLIGDVEVDFND